MTVPTFTKGPWRVHVIGRARYIRAADGTVICTPDAIPAAAANADLIAGAPELLAIADRFFAFYELHKSARGGQLGREFEELRAKIMGEVKP